MIRMLPIFVFTLLALFLFSALMRSQPSGGGSDPIPLPALPLKDAQSMDAPLTADALKGRITVINFFASWCAPCAVEMPELTATKKAMPDVQFIGIAWNDAPAKIDPWLAKHGNPFDRVAYDPGGRSAIALGLRGIPETFIIDASGMQRYRLSGTMLESIRLKEFEPMLATLRAEMADAK